MRFRGVGEASFMTSVCLSLVVCLIGSDEWKQNGGRTDRSIVVIRSYFLFLVWSAGCPSSHRQPRVAFVIYEGTKCHLTWHRFPPWQECFEQHASNIRMAVKVKWRLFLVRPVIVLSPTEIYEVDFRASLVITAFCTLNVQICKSLYGHVFNTIS